MSDAANSPRSARRLTLEAADVTVRPARPEDADDVLRLLNRSWLTTWAPELPLEAVKRFAERGGAGAYIDAMLDAFDLAEVGGDVVAMLHVHEGSVGALHVHPDWKGCGIGSRLLRLAEKRLSEAQPTGRLEVVAWNTAALDFYRRRGWAEVQHYDGDEFGAPVVIVEMAKRFSG